MVPNVVVLDTCVLISNVLRGVMLRLACQGCFEPAWSAVIGDEWRRNAARIWDVSAEDVAQCWEDMQVKFPAADQGDVSDFKNGLVHSDPKDWHVIAAARAVLARRPGLSVSIVTRNIRDFRRSELRGYGVGLLDPDQFLVRCLEGHPALLKAGLACVPEELVAAGRERESLEVILRRERLFRLNKLLGAGGSF